MESKPTPPSTPPCSASSSSSEAVEPLTPGEEASVEADEQVHESVIAQVSRAAVGVHHAVDDDDDDDDDEAANEHAARSVPTAVVPVEAPVEEEVIIDDQPKVKGWEQNCELKNIC